MKKRVCNLCSIAFLILAVINFTACKIQRITCVAPPPDLIEPVTFNLVGKSMQEEFEIYQGNMKEGYYREQLFSWGKDNLLDFIKQYCHHKHITVDEQTMGVILYYNSPVSPTFAVTDENIQGISVYCVEKRKLIHHLFVKNEQSEFYEVENTKVAVRGITTNHIHFYLENYVFKDPQNRSYISISIPLNVSDNIKKRIKRTPMRFEVESAASGQSANGVAYPCPFVYLLTNI